MPLSGSVASNKDSSQGFQPLLLCAFTLQGTSTPLLLATHNLDGTDGPTFPGIGALPAGAYAGRILQQSIDALQHRSQLGIDRVSKVTLTLMDADHFLYNNICKVYGFRGATLQMALVLWEAGTSNFSSDAPLMFTGVADMERPSRGMTLIEVSANTSHNTAVVRQPFFIFQNRCPLHFPKDAAERAMAGDAGSKFCMYNPGGTGGAVFGPVGNIGPANHTNSYGQLVTDGSGYYILCEFIRSNPSDGTVGCMARLGNSATTSVAPDGDLGHDQAGHWTGGFAGIEWSPGVYYTDAKNFVSNSKIPTFSFLNAAILGQYANLVYGQQFINAKVATIVESGNDTKVEVVIYSGEHDLNYVPFPVVNGVEVNRFGQGAVDKSLGWDWANDGTNTSTGGRRGTMLRFDGWNDRQAGYSALGDPFGSLCRMGIVVYKDLFTGFGTPTVQVRTIGPKVAVFSSQTSYSLIGAPSNSNPAWVILDILNLSNWQYQEVSMQTFIDAAVICDLPVSYITSTGGSATHSQYKAQFSLESRKTAAELIAGVLRCCNGYLYWNQTGQLCIGINQTLADQQSSPVPGSNYNTAVSSIHADGSGGTGYAAYLFDETVINLKTVEFEQNATVMTPNRININFQDEDNSFVVDSLNEVDPHSVDRAGGALNPGGAVIDETLNVTGISNFDQAIRIANVYIAERQYGNEGGDARGTRVLSFDTTVRCESLRVGHIVLYSSQAYGIVRQTFRVIKIQPSTNFQTAKVTIQWHNDLWYTYAYGQNPQSFYSNPGTSRNPGPPKTWQPNGEVPNVPAANAYPDLTATEINFALAEIDGLDAKGNPLIQLQLSGMLPINQISAGAIQPPRVPTQATLGSGGSIPAGKIIYIKICSIDAFGNYSTASQTITSPVTTGSNTITINNVGFPASATNYDIFAGYDHFSLTFQQGGPVSTSITFGSMANVRVYGPPDVNADSVFAQAKLVIHGGIIGSNVGSLTSTTVMIGGPASGTFSNTITGYKLLLIGRQSLGATLPIIEFRILGYSLSSGAPVLIVDRDPTALLQTQDIVVIGAQANIATATTIGDANFVSAYAPFGVSPDGTLQPDVGQVVRIIYGTGRFQSRTITGVQASTGGTNWDTYEVGKPWDVIPDSTSMFIVEEQNWPDSSPATTFNAPFLSTAVATSVPVTNYRERTVLVQALIEDSGSVISVERRAPFRMYYITGSQGTKQLTFADSPYTQTIVDGTLQCDTTGGNITIQLLSHVFIPNVSILIQKVSSDANVVIINWATGEADWNGDTTRQLTSDMPPDNYTEIFFPGA